MTLPATAANDAPRTPAPWLGDPRLPDRNLAMQRIFGDLRPRVSEPWRAPVLAERVIPPKTFVQGVRLTVKSNRTRTRWWFVVTYAPDYQYMADYASTTSARVAQGWIDALQGKRARRTRRAA